MFACIRNFLDASVACAGAMFLQGRGPQTTATLLLHGMLMSARDRMRLYAAQCLRHVAEQTTVRPVRACGGEGCAGAALHSCPCQQGAVHRCKCVFRPSYA